MILVNVHKQSELDKVMKLIKIPSSEKETLDELYGDDTVLFLRETVTSFMWSYQSFRYTQQHYPNEPILSFYEFIEQYYPENLASPEPTEDITRYSDLLVSDPIYKPSHYQLEDGTQVKDHITSLTAHMSGVRAWATGNAIKYLARAGRKDDMVKDLKKAQENIQIIIDDVEKENN